MVHISFYPFPLLILKDPKSKCINPKVQILQKRPEDQCEAFPHVCYLVEIFGTIFINLPDFLLYLTCVNPSSTENLKNRLCIFNWMMDILEEYSMNLHNVVP